MYNKKVKDKKYGNFLWIQWKYSFSYKIESILLLQAVKILYLKERTTLFFVLIIVLN